MIFFLLYFASLLQQDKVCVLVTHQLQYLKDVEHIVLMNGGVAEAQGSYHSLEAANTYPMLATLVHEQEVQQQHEKEQLPQVEDFLDNETNGGVPALGGGADGEVSADGIGMGNFTEFEWGISFNCCFVVSMGGETWV